MTPGSADNVSDALRRIWERSRDTTRERIAAVERAAVALVKGTLDEDTRERGRAEAHKLAGTLGTFGFAAAGACAKEAELLLAPGGLERDSGAAARLANAVVEMQRVVEDEEADAAAPEPVSAQAGQHLSVVAVDDDEVLLATLQAQLAEAGFDVTAVSDSERAVETVIAVGPAFVILDVDMPGLDGLEVCRRLRAEPRTADVPIMFLTSRGDRHTSARLFEAGADDHLTKPAATPELVSRIRHRLARLSARTPAPGSAGAAEAEAPVPASVAPPEPVAPDYTVDVVVVDDDPVLLDLLTHSLASRGYSLSVIHDGTEAVRQLGGESPLRVPRVILLDVGLPGLDGFAVLRALSRDGVTRRSPVIMLTARTLETEVVDALELGAFDHVAKPFSIPVLMQRLRRAIESKAR